VPQRTCAGCRRQAPKTELLRIVLAGGSIVVDRAARAPGRAGYVHPTTACVDAAISRGGLARALRASVPAEAAGRLRDEIREQQGHA
jgi:predicted RNA-binding protein YlxR (DUF448 family)